MQPRRILIFVLGLMFFVCPASFVFAQSDNFGPLKFTPPRGFTRNQTDNALVFRRVDRRRQRFCFVTLYAAGASDPSPRKGFEKEWTNRIVGPFGAADRPDTETEILNRLTFVSAGAEVYIDGNRATAYLAVVNGHGRAASLLGIYNDNACSGILEAFIEDLDIDPR